MASKVSGGRITLVASIYIAALFALLISRSATNEADMYGESQTYDVDSVTNAYVFLFVSLAFLALASWMARSWKVCWAISVGVLALLVLRWADIPQLLS
ncbi:hypothetical protein AB0I00_08715 [Streptomyces sp. NPDC050803]|uniref:hypothetical protein n=1 Tax=unclassified Streptomyces TaxID=2593676 RepID=UPI003429E2E4